MTAADTNILFYVHDSRYPAKQRIAAQVVESLLDGALLWQVACEYLWASRKLEPQGYVYGDAMRDIRMFRQVWTPVAPAWPVLDRVLSLKDSHGLSHWDALLIGTCLEGGVTTLYSEDFRGLSRVESLEILNPFL